MFEKIKAKIEELKAEIEAAVNADEVKADEAALSLLQGWTDGLTALKKVLEDREKPLVTPDAVVAVEAAPSEPAQEAKGDASEADAPKADSDSAAEVKTEEAK